MNAYASLKETDLEGKVAVITGGVQGIGLATARRFRAEGSQVVIVDIKSKTSLGEEVALELGATFMPVDITDEINVNAMVDTVFDQFGRIDVLVNNAGITADGKLVSYGKTGELRSMSLERWNRVLQVNLDGAFICSQAVLRYMVPARSGCLLFASSLVAVTGNMGQANYGVSKKALIALMEACTRDLGEFGIRANAVLPGFTKTTMIETVPDKVLDYFIGNTPLGRLIDPEDIANAYVWLASYQARSVNGICLPVDCGLKL